ncbi:hypothetical protein K443DRAFT_14423 [Laccaria amethystina LaAM-08-1]|uniref:Uncharacterized protein n=1 Tax=Laccaria amethystina LaAM-08-1 TaxID=1095629 RepID=A0A0C9WHL6_9AGAR|nr:hypothetical protein K443DRAFT_14423 [Laccaria amethystina LaAM-08-1]
MLTRSHRFPSARMEVQQDVALHDKISLVDTEDAWELAEMSGRRIVTQQDVAVRADSEDRREVAEMSGSRMTVGDVRDMITLMDSEDLRGAETDGAEDTAALPKNAAYAVHKASSPSS